MWVILTHKRENTGKRKAAGKTRLYAEKAVTGIEV
jgi:hypothetical protein